MRKIVDMIRNMAGLLGIIFLYLGASTVDYAAEAGKATDWRPCIIGAVLCAFCGMIVLVEMSEDDYD